MKGALNNSTPISYLFKILGYYTDSCTFGSMSFSTVCVIAGSSCPVEHIKAS